ncbi:MAG: molybdopterin-guanine dinucleotide biosynthesis protein B [Simplicispira sp.]|nr:molybdopterin-guanine dinucleotide biosynthesis protein B [Simplicispira sp.]
MKIFGITGHSGMGKTTLLEKLIPELCSRGLTVSLIKHSHKDIEVDRPGKDSYRLRGAGCTEVMLLGHSRWALMHELRGASEPPLEYLLARLQTCDVVLLEGFKSGDFPKLEVWRDTANKPPLGGSWPGIVATASDALHLLPPGLIKLDLSHTKAIANLVLRKGRPLAEFLETNIATANAVSASETRVACQAAEI